MLFTKAIKLCKDKYKVTFLFLKDAIGEEILTSILGINGKFVQVM